MTALWSYSEGVCKTWFRATWVLIANPDPGVPPTLKAEVIRVRELPGGDLVRDKVGDVDLDMAKLTGADLANAQEAARLLQDLIGAAAAPMIQAFIQSGGRP